MCAILHAMTPAERKRQWKHLNPEKWRAQKARWRKRHKLAHPEKWAAQKKARRSTDRPYSRLPDGLPTAARKSFMRKRSISEVRASYAREMLARAMGIRARSVPTSLVEAKRVQLKLVRLLREEPHENA